MPKYGVNLTFNHDRYYEIEAEAELEAEFEAYQMFKKEVLENLDSDTEPMVTEIT